MEEEGPKKDITIEIKKPALIALIVFSIVILALELSVTFSTPIVFGDEGFHTRLAQLIAEEGDYFSFYSFEGTTLTKEAFHRPPLWNLLEAGYSFIFGFSELFIKFLTPFIAVMTGIAIFLLVKRLLNEKIAFMAAVITITIPSFVTYSVLFYTDILLSFYVAMSVLLFLIATKTNSRKYLILAAVFASLAFLTKVPGIAVIMFFGVIMLYELVTERKYYTILKKYGLVFSIFIILILGFTIRNQTYYDTPLCYNPPILDVFNTEGCAIDNYDSSYSFASRTSGGGTEQNVFSMGLVNYLNFSYGSMWFIIFGSLGGLFILAWKKDKFINMLLLYLLFFLLLFPTIVSRAEDTARFLVSWTFMFGILTAAFFSEIHHHISRFNKYIALGVFIFVLVLSFQNFYPKLVVMEQVKQFSPLFFEACDWVDDNLPEDARLYTVWTHRTVYNCQRDGAGPENVPDIALSNDPNISAKAAKDNGIDYLFIQKFSIDTQNRNIVEQYNLNYVNMLENNNETFIKVYENGPSLEQCLQQGGCDGSLIYKVNI